MNPLVQLSRLGQSVWLDFITRDLLRSGELSRLVVEDGLRGMTTNPTIFEKAIAGSTLYDSDIRRLAASGNNPGRVVEALPGHRRPMATGDRGRGSGLLVS